MSWSTFEPVRNKLKRWSRKLMFQFGDRPCAWQTQLAQKVRYATHVSSLRGQMCSLFCFVRLPLLFFIASLRHKSFPKQGRGQLGHHHQFKELFLSEFHGKPPLFDGVSIHSWNWHCLTCCAREPASEESTHQLKVYQAHLSTCKT